jgi:hypothetical protein
VDDSSVEIPQQQDGYLVGSVLLNGSIFAHSRSHGSSGW